MFLTDADIRRLTGLRGLEQQIAWLAEHGIRHWVNAAGKPIVPRSAIDTPWKQIEPTLVQGGRSGQQLSGFNAEPPDGSNLEARVAKLESDVGHIKDDVKDVKTDIREMRKDAKEDFRILFGALIVVALGLAGLLAKGFHWF